MKYLTKFKLEMGLFDTFKEVSHQDWLDKITLDLKGKDFNDTLVWKSSEGVDVQPFYNQTIQSSTPIKTNNDWIIDREPAQKVRN